MSKRTHQSIVYNADGVEFTIYQTIKTTKAGPRGYWLLEDYSTGKRRLLSHTTEQAARQRANKIRAAMVKGQASRMAFSNGEWQDVCAARQIIRGTEGGSLTRVAQEWADCRFRLPVSVSLMDAVQFYMSQYKGEPPPRPAGLAGAAGKYHQFKLGAGKSKGHCRNIKSRMNRLIKALPPGVLLDELTAGQLDMIIMGFKLKEKTRNEYRMLLNNFYRWAAKQNPPLAAKGFSPAKEMERHKVKHQEVGFLRVADLRKILASAPAKRPDLLPLIVLVCFAGLRPSEAVRLDWCEIGADYIRLPGKKSKTGYSRQIPITQNLKAWLARWRKSEGPVCPPIDPSHFNRAIRHFSGVCLSHDSLRHSYGTHRQQIVKNVGAVADEMGNSPQICRRHYLNAFCTEDEAREWFGLMPATVSNIINLPGESEVQSVAADAKTF